MEQSRAGAGVRVLVVDDDPSIRLLCRVNLEAAGVRVQEAADGRAALAAAIAEPPDVAFVDVMMPGLDGWELAAELRANEETSHIAVVFITALTGEAAETRARELGATYISKPFNPLELPRIVAELAG